MNHKIGIVGLGMVGTPLARYFEEVKGFKRGKDLLLYDADVKKSYSDDVNRADIIFLCLPTPRDPQNGSCDISILESAFQKIDADKVVVIKSTVIPGTTEYFQKKHPKLKVLFNPEFLTESRAWEDMLRPDRQIVGFTEQSLDSANVVLSLLPKAPFMSPWGLGTYKPIRLTATEAELVKYASNVYFVRKVNWANALSDVSEKFGANYENVRVGMAADHRIGDSHLDVSQGGYRGWGGYCFPKDLDAFIAFAKTSGLKNVHDLLMGDRTFNEKLLMSQGLSLAGVSKHIGELELMNHKKTAPKNKNKNVRKAGKK